MQADGTANGHEILLARLLQARKESDAVFRMVKPEAIYDRPIDERHRIIFYIGHLEAFDWNLLSGSCKLTSFNPEFNHLFAFGIDPVGRNLPSDQPRDWPRLEAVYEYRDRARGGLDEVLDTVRLPDRGEGGRRRGEANAASGYLGHAGPLSTGHATGSGRAGCALGPIRVRITTQIARSSGGARTVPPACVVRRACATSYLAPGDRERPSGPRAPDRRVE